MDEESIQPAGGAGAPAPVSKSARFNLYGTMPTEGEAAEKYKRNVAEYTENLVKKPIFLLAVHGLYKKRDVEAPVQVPKSTVLVEFTTIGEYATCALGFQQGTLYSLLRDPTALAHVLTAQPGGSYKDSDIDALYRSPKYDDRDTYYQRTVGLSKEDSEEHFFIHRFYNGKIRNEQYLRDWLLEKYEIQLNTLIDYIYENDEDVRRNGCIIILASCGNVNKKVQKITEREIRKITSRYDKHRRPLVAYPIPRFEIPKYRPRIMSKIMPLRKTRRKPKVVKPVSSFFIRPKNKTVPSQPHHIRLIGNSGFHAKRLSAVHEPTSTRKRSAPTNKFMIQVGDKIYYKDGKILFSGIQIEKIIRELKRTPPDELPTIRLYDSEKRRWLIVYQGMYD
jgi:hypothetical protein